METKEAMDKYKAFLPKTPLVIDTADGMSYRGTVINVLEKEKCFMVKEIKPDGKLYIISFGDILDMEEDKSAGIDII